MSNILQCHEKQLLQKSMICSGIAKHRGEVTGNCERCARLRTKDTHTLSSSSEAMHVELGLTLALLTTRGPGREAKIALSTVALSTWPAALLLLCSLQVDHESTADARLLGRPGESDLACFLPSPRCSASRTSPVFFRCAASLLQALPFSLNLPCS